MTRPLFYASLVVETESLERVHKMAYVSQSDKKELATEIKAVLKEFGMKGTISVRHHSTLLVKVKGGDINFGDQMPWNGSVNEYHIETSYTGIAKEFLLKLLDAMEGPKFFNHTDSMSDYFHRSHYTDIELLEGCK